MPSTPDDCFKLIKDAEVEINKRIFNGNVVTLKDVYEAIGLPLPIDPDQRAAVEMTHWDGHRWTNL